MGEGTRREKKATRLRDGGGTGGGWRGGSSQGTHVCQCTTRKHRGQAREMGKMEREMGREVGGGAEFQPSLHSARHTLTHAHHSYTCGAGAACLPVYTTFYRYIFIKCTEELVAGGLTNHDGTENSKHSLSGLACDTGVKNLLIFGCYSQGNGSQKNCLWPCYTFF